jgi:hypothetical protein
VRRLLHAPDGNAVRARVLPSHRTLAASIACGRADPPAVVSIPFTSEGELDASTHAKHAVRAVPQLIAPQPQRSQRSRSQPSARRRPRARK